MFLFRVDGLSHDLPQVGALLGVWVLALYFFNAYDTDAEASLVNNENLNHNWCVISAVKYMLS